MDVADYVLKKPSSEEQDKLDAAITKAIGILPLLLEGNTQDAMQILHGPN
jgi:PTH1 family peptidyl-tRNA hydrolase